MRPARIPKLFYMRAARGSFPQWHWFWPALLVLLHQRKTHCHWVLGESTMLEIRQVLPPADHSGMSLPLESAQCWPKIAWLHLPGPSCSPSFLFLCSVSSLNYLETYGFSCFSYFHSQSLFILVTLPKAHFVRWSNFHHIREIILADVSCTQEAQTSTGRLVWQM